MISSGSFDGFKLEKDNVCVLKKLQTFQTKICSFRIKLFRGEV